MEREFSDAAEVGQDVEVCGRCAAVGSDVEERYSFGVYAGVLCRQCAMRYRDHCGIDQPQGDPRDLDEQYDED